MENTSNKNILIIDDSAFVLSIIEKAILKDIENITIHKAQSFAQAKEIVNDIFFHAAIVDVVLPDAKDGEAIDLSIALGIPTIVLTGTTDSHLHSDLISKNIFELILKNNSNNIAYVVFALKRILKNYMTHVMIVDDSKSMRSLVSRQLKKLHLNVFEAEDPLEAMMILEDKNNHITLIITDYDMPNMNGLEFTLRLRQHYRKNVLSIIALSGVDEQGLSAKFLKHGANDFLHKPFEQEELFVRVNSNLELLDMFDYYEEYGTKDFLSGLYNRKYFLEQSERMLEEAKRHDYEVALAFFEIDNLREIHKESSFCGSDMIQKNFAEMLQKSFPSPMLIARFSDEKFSVLAIDIKGNIFDDALETLRVKAAKSLTQVQDILVSFTVSGGSYEGKVLSIDELIQIAESNLQSAQSTGRNKIVSFQSNTLSDEAFEGLFI
ncbi:response regulator [Sulfuricurvum sp.]|uniref:GGDEF domain-containing response regulator n=1 Tax=Sulfuricurvum sp. TaxID=2025608 RepID=UPI00286E88CE|nr:response regulator [Sulfuricurvum sp.]